MPRIRVMGVRDRNEAWGAMRCGATALGFHTDNPEYCPKLSDVRRIAHELPRRVTTYATTNVVDADMAIELHRECGVTGLQFTRAVPNEVYRKLRWTLPGVSIIQTLRVHGPEAVEDASLVAGFVDALALDISPLPRLITEKDATPSAYIDWEWEICLTVKERVRRPVFVAGATTVKQLGQAIEYVKPFAMDMDGMCRTDGRLDEPLLTRILSHLRNGTPFLDESLPPPPVSEESDAA